MMKTTDVAIANAICRARSLAGIESDDVIEVARILRLASDALLEESIETGSPIARDQSEVLRAVSTNIEGRKYRC